MPAFGPPVFRAALISCTSMAAGDALCQCIRARAAGKDGRINLRQTMNFGLVGLTLHGPYFYNAFRWLDSRFGTALTLRKALLKTVTGQVTVFPVYLTSFFMYMGLLEGLTPKQCVSKLQKAFLPTYATGTLFWPAANVVNFMFVPPASRVLYVNAAGLFWNAWLSYENTTKGLVAAVDGGGGSGDGKQH